MKPLGIQMTCSRYLKASPNLFKYDWNTFESIRDLPDGLSGKSMSILLYEMPSQNLKKKIIFFKDGFPAVQDDYISFSIVFEAAKFRHANDMFKVFGSIIIQICSNTS